MSDTLFVNVTHMSHERKRAHANEASVYTINHSPYRGWSMGRPIRIRRGCEVVGDVIECTETCMGNIYDISAQVQVMGDEVCVDRIIENDATVVRIEVAYGSIEPFLGHQEIVALCNDPALLSNRYRHAYVLM